MLEVGKVYKGGDGPDDEYNLWLLVAFVGEHHGLFECVKTVVNRPAGWVVGNRAEFDLDEWQEVNVKVVEEEPIKPKDWW